MTASAAGNPESLTLIVRRTVSATPERLFRAWTDAHEFVRWWGPKGVVCESAEIDLRVGGAYRIANRLPDGRLIWISGTFDLVEPPLRVAYSWLVDPGPLETSHVVVSFVARGDKTEVVVTHQRIGSEDIRSDHERGWAGCLDGLAAYLK